MLNKIRFALSAAATILASIAGLQLANIESAAATIVPVQVTTICTGNNNTFDVVFPRLWNQLQISSYSTFTRCMPSPSTMPAYDNWAYVDHLTYLASGPLATEQALAGYVQLMSPIKFKPASTPLLNSKCAFSFTKGKPFSVQMIQQVPGQEVAVVNICRELNYPAITGLPTVNAYNKSVANRQIARVIEQNMNQQSNISVGNIMWVEVRDRNGTLLRP